VLRDCGGLARLAALLQASDAVLRTVALTALTELCARDPSLAQSVRDTV
jgi:hypothetical protein